MDVKITKKELDIMVKHFLHDFDFGVGGTWGDGENWNDVQERKAGAKLVTKLKKMGF